MKDTNKNDAQQAQEVQNTKAAANDILQSLSNINNIENFTIKYNELISSGALDPDNPNFDIDLFNSDFFISAELSSYLDNFKEQLSIYLNSKEYQKHAAIVEAIYKYVKENGTETDTAGKLIIKDNYKPILSRITELARLIETDPAYNNIDVTDIMKAAFDDTGKPIKEPFIAIINRHAAIVEAISNYVKENGTKTDTAGKLIINDNYKRILSRITELAQLIETDPAYNNIDVTDIMKAAFDDTGKPINTLENIKIINLIGTDKQKNNISREMKGLYKPTDIVNNGFWDKVIKQANNKVLSNGQLGLIFNSGKRIRGEKNEGVKILCSLRFDDDLQLSKNLTWFDELVLNTVSTMICDGIAVTTLSNILYCMGYDARPNSKQIELVYNSLCKLMACRITVSNELEIEQGYKYPEIDIKREPLIVFREDLRTSPEKNLIIDGAINFYVPAGFKDYEPPLMRIARGRKQITRLPRAVFSLPPELHRKGLCALVERYLIKRLILINGKNKKEPIENKILYKSLFEACDISESSNKRMQRSRALDYADKLLKHYINANFISSYKQTDDAFIIEPKEKKYLLE